MSRLFFGVVLTSVCASPSLGAARVIESAPIQDVDFDQTGTAVAVGLAPAEPVVGIALDARWTAVIADQADGVAPWAIDMVVTADAPGGAGGTLGWFPVGGDVTIADFPLSDFREGWNPGTPAGDYTFTFAHGNGVAAPFVSGLRDATVYLLADAPEVVSGPFVLDAAGSGRTWNRPFFIDGVSGLGPTSYETLEINPPVSGGYLIEAQVSSFNSAIFLYRGAFDPAQPLRNLLDYSLGNGSFWDGTPQGEGRVSALLFEEEPYTLVVSQWDRFPSSDGQTYEVLVTGPGAVGPIECAADANRDGAADFLDMLAFLAIAENGDPEADLNADSAVNAVDVFTFRGVLFVGCP